jgi:hypothetical protein
LVFRKALKNDEATNKEKTTRTRFPIKTTELFQEFHDNIGCLDYADFRSLCSNLQILAGRMAGESLHFIFLAQGNGFYRVFVDGEKVHCQISQFAFFFYPGHDDETSAIVDRVTHPFCFPHKQVASVDFVTGPYTHPYGLSILGLADLRKTVPADLRLGIHVLETPGARLHRILLFFHHVNSPAFVYVSLVVLSTNGREV